MHIIFELLCQKYHNGFYCRINKDALCYLDEKLTNKSVILNINLQFERKIKAKTGRQEDRLIGFIKSKTRYIYTIMINYYNSKIRKISLTFQQTYLYLHPFLRQIAQKDNGGIL